MKRITDKEANSLQGSIDHILDSGANSVRLLEMIDRFLDRRERDKEVPEEIMYTESECRTKVFDFAAFVIDCMEGKKKSSCVGIWFELNKK